MKRPKTATLIFRTGKMVCTGAKSEKQARSAVRKVVRELKKAGIIILGKPEIEITNMVASANLHGKIDLDKASEVLDNIMYEPEQFPGAIYRMEGTKVVTLLFSSGKFVLVGARSEGDVRDAVERVRVKLLNEKLIF